MSDVEGMTEEEFDENVLGTMRRNPETFVDEFIDAIEQEKEARDQFLGFVKEHAGEVRRDKVKDALEQFDHVTDSMSKNEAESVAKMALRGETPAQSAKEIRDNEWWVGSPKKRLEDEDFEIPKRGGSEAITAIASVWKEKGEVTGQFWHDVRDRAAELGYMQTHDKVDKALEEGTLSAGGAMVEERISDEIISFLYASTVLPKMGARTIDISDGGIKMTRQTGAASAFWVGELEALSGSEQSFGKDSIEPHKLGVLVVMSNELLERTPAGFETLIEDDIEMVARLTMDQAGLVGDGQNEEPLGIYEQTEDENINTRVNPGSSASIAEIHQDQLRTINELATDKVDTDDETAGWILHPRTAHALAAQMTSDDKVSHFASMIASGNLQGDPFQTTTQMPTDLDDSGQATGDETRMLYGVFNQLVIGQGREMDIRSVRSGQVPDADGNTINMLTRDATAMVLFTKVDYFVRRKEAFAWLEGVDYAPDLSF